MSYPLGSLQADAVGAAPGGGLAADQAPAMGFRRQFVLAGGFVACVLLLLALATYQASDPAFSTSGSSQALRNKAGAAGAWVADLLYVLFGASAWWLVPITWRAWLSALARALRGPGPQAQQPAPRWLFWLGLALLMAASCGLEWTRLYRWESALPGHSGGIVGYVLGPLSMRWLGFAGSGVTWIALLVVGAALALRFSWARLADGIGERVEGLLARRQERKEQEQDRRIGEQALREREHVVELELERQIEDPPVPLVIEPAVLDVPRSDRVARERQQPLFTELSDTKLPQVDLLDTANGRQETVTPESLEMTSRLIEKKLKDFGVEVRVVAASPGPVITRYEIEPATGVKGSQVVNLAKDLARSLSLVSIRVVEV
ncbi:MAG: cell division FtsK transrane protein, partial [Pseudomonadota bacterium]